MMKTTKIAIYLMLALTVSGFYACSDFFETVVEVDIDELDNLLVVNYIYHEPYGAVFDNFLNVSKSKGVFESDYEYESVSNATAELYEGETLLAEFNNAGGGFLFAAAKLGRLPEVGHALYT